MSDGAIDPESAGGPESDRFRAVLIEARLALLAAAYPSLVNAESRQMVRDEIGHAIDRDNRLRRFALGNGDEPMPQFRPYRAAAPEGDA